jgi:protein-S-isoprenylcysteine O-methyltransferase Ste14
MYFNFVVKPKNTGAVFFFAGLVSGRDRRREGLKFRLDGAYLERFEKRWIRAYILEMEYFVLVILWAAWCALHSAMISLTVTESLRKRFPGGFRYYRILYNTVAAVTLLPVLAYTFSLKQPPLIAWSGPWRVVPVLLGAAALFFFAAGARRYDLKQFLGLRQIKDEKTCSVLTDDCSLDTGGVLSVVRHPWYSGGILIVWARPLDPAAIWTNLAVCGYFVVGAILEERKLEAQFGEQYADYRRRVSMLFPVKWAARLAWGKD